VIAAGVAGYRIIEGWSLFDALYMTVTTISTVGYKEVQPLSTEGRWLTIGLIVGGVGVMLYTVTAVAEQMYSRFGTAMEKRIAKEKTSRLRKHVIICGYGRVGREVAAVLKEDRIPLVAIDTDEDTVERANQEDMLCLLGDASHDDVLREAGINRARAIICAAGNDAANTYIVLSARGLRPDIYIVSRASSDEAESKLIRAGANRIVSPLQVGGRRMAEAALHPQVLDYIDTTVDTNRGELRIEEMAVDADCPALPIDVKQSQDKSTGAAILVIKRRDGTAIIKPEDDTSLECSDELVVIGTRAQLASLERILRKGESEAQAPSRDSTGKDASSNANAPG
jgi:voltage-gated potassium channel